MKKKKEKKKRSCRASLSLAAAGVVVVVGWVVIKLRICEGSNEASKVVAAEVKRYSTTRTW